MTAPPDNQTPHAALRLPPGPFSPPAPPHTDALPDLLSDLSDVRTSFPDSTAALRDLIYFPSDALPSSSTLAPLAIFAPSTAAPSLTPHSTQHPPQHISPSNPYNTSTSTANPFTTSSLPSSSIARLSHHAFLPPFPPPPHPPLPVAGPTSAPGAAPLTVPALPPIVTPHALSRPSEHLLVPPPAFVHGLEHTAFASQMHNGLLHHAVSPPNFLPVMQPVTALASMQDSSDSSTRRSMTKMKKMGTTRKAKTDANGNAGAAYADAQLQGNRNFNVGVNGAVKRERAEGRARRERMHVMKKGGSRCGGAVTRNGLPDRSTEAYAVYSADMRAYYTRLAAGGEAGPRPQPPVGMGQELGSEDGNEDEIEADIGGMREKVRSDVEKRFICEKCGVKFGDCGSLERHLARMHAVRTRDLVRCDVCNMGFASRTNMQRHRRMAHEGSGRWECGICGVPFSSKRIYNKHLAKEHDGKKGRKRNLERVYRCEDCDYSSKWGGNVKRHRGIKHLGLKEFVCQTCDRGFSTKNNLQTHEATHEAMHDA